MMRSFTCKTGNRVTLILVGITCVLSALGCAPSASSLIERQPVVQPKPTGEFKVSVAVDGKSVNDFSTELVHRMQVTPQEVKRLAATLPKRVNVPFGSVPEVSFTGDSVGFRLTPKRSSSESLTLGLRAGDVVTAINKTHPSSVLDFRELISSLQSDKRASITILRSGEPHKILYYLVSSSS